MRILVTGAAGGLGRATVAALPAHHDVVACTRRDLDIGDHDAVMAMLHAVRPEVVLNCAAFSKVDANEAEPSRAFRDNALGPQSLALGARAVGAAMVHVSTDYVFDGGRGAPYDETDPPGPLSTYGRSKLAGEQLVRRALPEHAIVRVGYLFGAGEDYLSSQVGLLQRGERAAGIEDRIGSPTYVRDVASRLLPLLLTGRFGTYHLAGPDSASWFDVLERCRVLGGFEGEVTAQRADDLRRPAPRPVSSVLTSVYLDHLPIPPMPGLDEALVAFLDR